MPPRKPNMTFHEVHEMIEMAREQLKMKEDVIADVLSAKDITLEKAEAVYNYYSNSGEGTAIENFDKVTEDDEIDKAYSMVSGETTSDHLEEYETDREESRYNCMKALVADVIKEFTGIVEDREKLAELDTEFKDALDEHEKYITSEEYDKDKLKKVDEIKDSIGRLQAGMIGDEIKDYFAKKDIVKYERESQVILQRYSLEYLYDRLDSPDTKDTEVSRLMSLFFDKRKSAYIMQRYRDKCNQLGLPSNVVESLIGIEEKFLEPEFHIYNNFYLFFVTSCVAYADRDVPREVMQPLQNMISLVYNKFSTEEARTTFLDSIRGFLQRFADYRDVFSEKNITQPNHPYRLEKEAERRAAYRTKLIHQIIVKDPTQKDNPRIPHMNIDDLEALYKDLLNPPEEPTEVENVETTSSIPSGTAKVLISGQGRHPIDISNIPPVIGVDPAGPDSDVPVVSNVSIPTAADHYTPDDIPERVARGATAPIIYEAATEDEVAQMEDSKEEGVNEEATD